MEGRRLAVVASSKHLQVTIAYLRRQPVPEVDVQWLLVKQEAVQVELQSYLPPVWGEYPDQQPGTGIGEEHDHLALGLHDLSDLLVGERGSEVPSGPQPLQEDLPQGASPALLGTLQGLLPLPEETQAVLQPMEGARVGLEEGHGEGESLHGTLHGVQGGFVGRDHLTQVFPGFVVQPRDVVCQVHTVGGACVHGNAAPPTHDQRRTRALARPEEELRLLVRAAAPVV